MARPPRWPSPSRPRRRSFTSRPAVVSRARGSVERPALFRPRRPGMRGRRAQSKARGWRDARCGAVPPRRATRWRLGPLGDSAQRRPAVTARAFRHPWARAPWELSLARSPAPAAAGARCRHPPGASRCSPRRSPHRAERPRAEGPWRAQTPGQARAAGRSPRPERRLHPGQRRQQQERATRRRSGGPCTEGMAPPPARGEAGDRAPSPPSRKRGYFVAAREEDVPTAAAAMIIAIATAETAVIRPPPASVSHSVDSSGVR